jgi:hypothetical protein
MLMMPSRVMSGNGQNELVVAGLVDVHRGIHGGRRAEPEAAKRIPTNDTDLFRSS